MPGKFLSFALALTLLGQDEVVFRSESRFIAVDCQVLNGDAAVTGLQREDFLVFDNNQPQTISSFGRDDQELDVMLMIDASQSTARVHESIQASASAAVAQLLPNDRVGMVVFNDEARVLLPLTNDRALIADRVAKIPKGRGGTELNETTLRTAQYLRQQARVGARRAIVMLSDNRGYENVTKNEVRQALWSGNVVFNLLKFVALIGHGRGDTREFAEATGGEVLPFRSEGVPLADLFQRLRQRYYFLYPEPATKAGELHRIRVELSPEAKKRLKDAKVRARTGYLGAP